MITKKRGSGTAVVIPLEGNWHKGSGGTRPSCMGRESARNPCQIAGMPVDNASILVRLEGMVEELAETQTKPRIEAKFRKPTLNDGQSLWRMARDSQVLDLNSSYAYLLWSRDFAETSIMATVDGEPVGFITGYMRPGEPGTLMVWQVAVDDEFRGRKLAGEMLDRLAGPVQADAWKPPLPRTMRPPSGCSPASRLAVRRRWTRAAVHPGALPGRARHRVPLPDRPAHVIPAGVQPTVRTARRPKAICPNAHPHESTCGCCGAAPYPGAVRGRAEEGSVFMTDIFETLESEVRSYSRGWPAVFTHGRGQQPDRRGRHRVPGLLLRCRRPELRAQPPDAAGRCGSTSPAMRSCTRLDMMTPAKREFLQTFKDVILEPRGLDYKVMFPGPTGTNTVEAALKLARKVTGRQHILSFTNAFHGMTLGSLSVTGNSMKRKGAGIPLTNSSKIPYDDYFDGETTDFLWLERVLEDSRLRRGQAGGHHRGDRPGRGRRSRRARRMAPRTVRAVPEARDPADRRRRPGRLRAYRHRSSASRRPASPRTSSASPSRSPASACRWR